MMYYDIYENNIDDINDDDNEHDVGIKVGFFVSNLKFWLDCAIIWSIKMYYDIYENDTDDINDDDEHDDEDQHFYWVDGKMMPMEL